MLRVARSQEGPLRSVFPVAGAAEAFPFRAEVFDRVFTAFALHHFGEPRTTAAEAFRVLRGGGSFAILDPIVPPEEREIDRDVHRRINEILAHSRHGHFVYYSLPGIEELLEGAGFRIARADRIVFPVDQEGTEGIPTGRHWLEVAERLSAEGGRLWERFQEHYFWLEKDGEKVHVRGNFHMALVSGEKR
jgi:SAM-dependent methyltransferase